MSKFQNNQATFQSAGPVGQASSLKGWATAAAWLAAFAGLFAAGVLSLGELLDLPVPCASSRGCAAVAAHPASRWFGVPLALMGVAVYLTLLSLLAWAGGNVRGRLALTLVSGAGAFTSLALVAYSHQVIQAICLWCLVSAVAMLLLFAASLLLLKRSPPMPKPMASVLPWGLALITATGLGLQAGLMKREALKPPIAQAALQGLPRADWLDPAKSLGPEDAPVTVVLFGDFWCAACRSACESLRRYQAQLPQKVRLVYRHRPLWDLPGHRFSGTAAALSEIAAEQGRFWDFVEKIHQQRAPLDADGHVRLMAGLGLNVEGLAARLADLEDGAVRRAQRDVELAERLGIQSTPTFVILVEGQPAISASLASLPRVLNAKEVLALTR